MHATLKTLQEISLQLDKPVALGITGPGMSWEQAEARIAYAEAAVRACDEMLRVLGARRS
jgi:6,7-dimethyl-8-ribityllumazine synthase